MRARYRCVLELYQAEWCPYSSAVRERLTELGVDFIARQVAPRQEDREGQHGIPLLVTEDGERFEGTDAVFGYLATMSGTSAATARSGVRIASTGRRRRPPKSSPSRPR
jgi:glutaredoxin